jgi:3-hydroxybutyryl-CoA dehydrogenase
MRTSAMRGCRVIVSTGRSSGAFSFLSIAPMEIRQVGVVGLGTMGAGIAQVAAHSGYEVVGREVTKELADKARATIEHYLGRAVEKERMSADERDAALARLRTTTDLEDLADCDLVIEAIVEDLDAKRELFAELDRITRPDAILASNTSAISISKIAEATERPERVVGMHFFNPAPLLPLVEIIRADRSSDEAVDAAYAWAESAGKEPVRCLDTPGFIVNRALVPALNDCIRLLDEGVTPEDLDKAMTKGVGWPMGPCALVDLVGVDIHVHASQALYDATGDERMAPPERLKQMEAAGNLGRKTGKGFFEYD